MKRNSRNVGPDPREALLSSLGEPDERWMELVRASERPRAMGCIGEYELLEEVREGGQGLVFRARQPGTGREIALKRLAAGVFSTSSERRRFEREVELVAGLSHPNIVTVHGVEDVDGVALLAMEWVDGRSITSWARELGTGAGATREKLRVFLDACGAVQYAHRCGVIHRDLKPSNLLVDVAGRCRVLDFGLARRLPGASNEEAAADPTRTVGFLGTPTYAAPEHFADGTAPLDVRSDVYSLGVVLYELLTGRRPFDARRIQDLIAEVLERDPQRPSALAADLDHELDAIALKALAKDPSHRYQTVHALAEDVARHLDGLPVQAVPPSARYAAAKWIRRHRLVFSLAVLLASLTLGFVAFGAWQARRLAEQRDRAELEEQKALAALRAVEEEQERVVRTRDALQAALGVARSERDKARAVQDFYLDSILAEREDTEFGALTDVLSVVERMGWEARERFARHPDVAAELLAQVARTMVFVQRPESALRLADEGLAVQALDPEHELGTHAMLLQTRGEALDAAGHRDEARRHLQQAVAIYGTLDGLPRSRSAAQISLGRLELLAEDLEAAESCYREALQGLDAVPTEVRFWDHLHNRIAATSGLCWALLKRGETAEPMTLLVELLQSAEGRLPPGSIYYREIYRPLIEVCFERGAHAELARHLGRLAPITSRAPPGPRDQFAEACLLAAASLRTKEAYQPALEILAAAESVAPSADLLCRLKRGHGEILARLERWEQALAMYDAAAARVAELDPADPTRIELEIERCRVAVKLDRRDEARLVLHVALDALVAGARRGVPLRPPYLDHLRQLADRLDERAELDAALAEAGLR